MTASIPNVVPLAELPAALGPLHRLWHGWRKDDRIPARRDMPVESLKPWLGQIALIEIFDRDRFRFKVYGSGLTEWRGRDLTGHAIFPEWRAVCAELLQVREPICLSERWPSDTGGRIEFRTLLLPLAEDGITVGQIVSCSHRMPRSD